MWKNITEQETVIEKLKSFYTSKKIAHAYLFYGTEGVGKDAAAIEFAKLLNCKNVQNDNEACDVCESCKKINSFRSEYFQLICALPAGKSDDLESDPIEKLAAADFDAYMEELQLKSENPYHHISIPNANNIRISSIRNLVSKIYLSSPAGTKKFFIISEADKMRQEAANALLKILEEPPKESVIILTTSRIDSLPKTIMGRCLRLHFEPLTTAEISKKLTENGGFGKKEIELVSHLSLGSYTRAIELLKIGAENIRNDVIQYLLSLLKDNYADTVLISRNITAKNDREKTKYFLFLLNIWLRDLLHVKCSAGEGTISNYDIIERITKLNSNYPNADIFRMITELEEAEKLIGQNVQLTLILVNLSFKLKRLFN